jgi:hypothetical protein
MGQPILGSKGCAVMSETFGNCPPSHVPAWAAAAVRTSAFFRSERSSVAPATPAAVRKARVFVRDMPNATPAASAFALSKAPAASTASPATLPGVPLRLPPGAPPPPRSRCSEGPVPTMRGEGSTEGCGRLVPNGGSDTTCPLPLRAGFRARNGDRTGGG